MDSGDMASRIEDLIRTNYYSEPFEFRSAIRRFVSGLDPAAADAYRREALARLAREPSVVHVMLCAEVPLAEAAPILVSVLEAERAPSQVSREILRVLGSPGDDRAYRAVERFVDSEQEVEALLCLARMDFDRTLPRLRAAMGRPHLVGVCLQALCERKKTLGWEAFLRRVVPAWAAGRPDAAAALRRALESRSAEYSPFRPEEIRQLLAQLDRLRMGNSDLTRGPGE